MSASSTSERNSPSFAAALPALRSAERRWAAALAIGPVVLLLLALFPQLDMSLRSPEIHFVVVTLCTLIAVALAAAVLNAARRHGDGRALLVGAAFLVIAAVFSIHAIATPNVLFVGRIVAVSWSGLLSLTLGGLILAISGLPIGPRLSDWLVRRFWLWVGMLGLAWAAYALLVLWLIPPTPPATAVVVGTVVAHNHAPVVQTAAGVALEPLLVTGLLGMGAYGIALWGHGSLYRRRPSAAGLALVGGVALLGEALLTQMVATNYAFSFWLYHLLEFAGCAALTMGVLMGLREGAPGAGLLESLLLPGTTARLRESYTHTLDHLVEDLEQGAAPGGAAAAELRLRFGLSAAQLAVFERAAQAVAEERQRRRQIEQLNSGLRQLEHDREQLTQLIVHDLKNPITAISGYLDFLRMGELDNDQAELVALARRSVNGLQSLVDDLLDIGRLEAGRLELQLEPVELAALLERAATQLGYWAAQDQKQITIEVAPGLPPLSADRRLLERLALNLLSNAIKHTPTGTKIALRAAMADHDPAWVAIEVADTGPGIPDERQATIFDKYTSGGDRAGQRSSGLGLTLCRLVAEAHGGQISVRSKAGEGTVFRVSLPGGA